MAIFSFDMDIKRKKKDEKNRVMCLLLLLLSYTLEKIFKLLRNREATKIPSNKLHNRELTILLSQEESKWRNENEEFAIVLRNSTENRLLQVLANNIALNSFNICKQQKNILTAGKGLRTSLASVCYPGLVDSGFSCKVE